MQTNRLDIIDIVRRHANMVLLCNLSVFKLWRNCLSGGLLSMLIVLASGCSQESRDREIKADIATKTKTDINFAGVNYTVDKGVVTLTGKCPSDKSKSETEQMIKSINIIKGINNQIVIAPVTIGPDLPLKQSVDSVLKTYPAIQANVSQNIVTLMGKAKKQDFGMLIPAIQGLHPARIDNRLVVE